MVMDDQLIIDWHGLPWFINHRFRSQSERAWVSCSDDTSFSWKGRALCSLWGNMQVSDFGRWIR